MSGTRRVGACRLDALLPVTIQGSTATIDGTRSAARRRWRRRQPRKAAAAPSEGIGPRCGDCGCVVAHGEGSLRAPCDVLELALDAGDVERHGAGSFGGESRADRSVDRIG